jgi:sec-independent protein translocase protein TatC
MAEDISSKKKSEGNPEKEMTFWEHLEELRWHLVRSAAVLMILAIVAFINRKIIFDQIILAPKNADFITYRLFCQLGDFLGIESICMKDFTLKIINIELSGQFMTHLYISFIVSLIAAFPYFLWEVWSFIRPALKEKERRYSRGAVLASTVLFFMGVLFSYYLIVPLTINFFGGYQVSEAVANSITLSSYVNSVITVTVACGVVFEMPILVFFLTKVGIVTPAFLKRNRKYSLIILLTISAIITPPDIASQIIVCLPLQLLYEFSIMVSKRVYKIDQKKKAAEELAG